MPNALISRLLQEMAQFKQSFVFSPFKLNEPFLDKRLKEICRRFMEWCPQGSLRLFTNGSALTQDNLEWVAELSRVKHLWVSLNSVRETDHQALMQFKRPMFGRIATQLDALHRHVQADTFPHPVMLSRVAQGTADDLNFLKITHRRWPRFGSILIKQDAWLQDIAAPQIPIPSAPCTRWFELSIMATGIASLCCMDSESKFPLGTVQDQTLLDIYNAPAWRERREKMLDRRGVAVCQTCSY